MTTYREHFKHVNYRGMLRYADVGLYDNWGPRYIPVRRVWVGSVATRHQTYMNGRLCYR